MPLLLALLSLCLIIPGARAKDPAFGFRELSPGLYRGGRPGSEAALAWLREQGIRTVVNLQGLGASFQPGEKPEEIEAERRQVEGLGLAFFHQPFSTGNSYTLSPEEEAELLGAVALMADSQRRPLYVHCFFGADRTGLVVAAYRILEEGCAFEKARDEMYARGGAWTRYVTEGQLPFLRALVARAKPGACPL